MIPAGAAPMCWVGTKAGVVLRSGAVTVSLLQQQRGQCKYSRIICQQHSTVLINSKQNWLELQSTLVLMRAEVRGTEGSGQCIIKIF